MATTTTINDGAHAALSTALNAYLALDPCSRDRLVPLRNKVIAIELQGLQVRFYIRVSDEGLQVTPRHEGETDTTLRGTPLTLLNAGLGKTKDNPAFSGELEISGDVETGRQFQAFFQGIDIDWEEHLSRLVGDVAAHQAGNLGREFVQWSQSTRENLAQDIGEYLQEEGRYVPHPDEVNAFLAAVDTVRNDSERLEQRILRLQRKMRENHVSEKNTQPAEKDT